MRKELIPAIDRSFRMIGQPDVKPKVDLEEGLLRTVYWYRRYLDLPSP